MAYSKRKSHEEQFRLIQQCRISGLSDYQWCRENGIKTSTFYNWVHRLKNNPKYELPARTETRQTENEIVPLFIADDTVGVRLPDPAAATENTRPTIEVTIGSVVVRVSNDADASLLTSVLRALGGASC